MTTEPPCLKVSPLGNPCDKTWGHPLPHQYAYGGVWETWHDAPYTTGTLPAGYRAEFRKPAWEVLSE